VVTNSGGPGILAADAMEPQGLELVELRPETVERLRPLFPPEASLRNPLDMIASAQAGGYRAALEALLDDAGIDAAVSIFVPPMGVSQEDVAEAIVAAARTHPEKPILAVLMGREGLPEGRAELHQAGIPAYIFPESAARALAALVRHRELSEHEEREIPRIDVDRERADCLLQTVREQGRSRLNELEALDLLDAYGIAVTPSRLARQSGEVVTAAEEVGWPVAVKVVSPDITHKSDVGGVVLGLEDVEDVRNAVAAMYDRIRAATPEARIHGVLVQRMMQGGFETIAGVTHDPLFGPVVMFGLGGIYVEALRDVVFRVAPFDDREAHAMVNGIRSAAILAGMRGRPPSDRAALAGVLRRLSQLATDFPEIEELDVNPLLAFEHGAVALDARVRVRRKPDD
jgi:acetyltransferase